MQLGEVKRGLKAYKASGASNEDFQRHVMFVQVCEISRMRCDHCELRYSLD